MKSHSARSDTSRAGGNTTAIHEDEIVDYSGTAEPMLPASEVSTVQLRPGPAPTDLLAFSSEKVSYLGLQHHVATVGVVVLKPDYFGFMWWDGSEDCRINGELARSTVLYTQGEQDGFHATGGARRTAGVCVHRNDFIQTIAALRGVGPEDVLHKRTALELSPEAAARFKTSVEVLVRNTLESGPGGSSGVSTADPSAAIFGLLVDAYLDSSPEQQREGRTRPSEQIVRQAEERFFAAQGAAVSLADLCAAARVSKSALYRAFHAVCGEPPHLYFHKRRLANARTELVRSPAYRGAIKHAALNAGMTELGRFSVEYQSLFGESPSATLNRKIHL